MQKDTQTDTQTAEKDLGWSPSTTAICKSVIIWMNSEQSIMRSALPSWWIRHGFIEVWAPREASWDVLWDN
jgi:hypothetical protein